MRGFEHGESNIIIYNCVVLAAIIATAIGIVVYLFIFWKRLKDDYASEIIFSTAFYVLLGILVGWFLSFKFFSDWFLWTGFAGSLLGLYFGNLRFKLRFFETFEALIISSLPWLSLTFLSDSVTHSSLSSFIAFLVVLLTIFVFYWLDTHFREFTWYRSGKVGFAGLATISTIFLIRAGASLTNVHVISFTGRFETIVSAGAAFIAFILLFNLSRKIE